MSILETFYILFKSDASAVKKGAEEAKKSTIDLESSLKSIDKASERAGQSFLTMAKSASGVLGAFVSAGAVFGVFKNAVGSMQELGDAARDLNVNAESLDAWGNAVQRTGGTARGFQGSLKSLSVSLNSTAAVALQSLPAIADSFERMNDAQANRYGKSLGLDQATIYLLQKGRREVEETIRKQKELGLITKEQVIITRNYDNSLYDLGRVFSSLTRDMAIPFLPALQKGFEYLIEHKDLITGAMIAITGAVGSMGIAFAIASPGIALVTAALIAFSAAYEDYQKFKAGDPSLIGLGVDTFNSQTRGAEKLISKVAPSFLDDQSLAKFSEKYAHLPKFLGGQGFTGNNTVNIGDVTIQTNATNGKEAAEGFHDYVNELWMSNSNFDNGVKI